MFWHDLCNNIRAFWKCSQAEFSINQNYFKIVSFELHTSKHELDYYFKVFRKKLVFDHKTSVYANAVGQPESF